MLPDTLMVEAQLINIHHLHVGCTFRFTVSTATPMILMLRPARLPGQWITSEQYSLQPRVPVTEVTDNFGNASQRLIAPVGEFVIATSADVIVQDEPAVVTAPAYVEVPDLPAPALQYLLPSRYCESDRFGEMAADIVADCAPGYAQVMAITQWVHKHIRNIPGSSTFPISAVELNQRREGVCRDLAQISIALCRALCIPARLVVGYLHALQPSDLHAWFQAYLGDRWYTFDATSPSNTEPRVVIAHGRDSADVAVYNQFGPLLLPDEMHVTISRQEVSQ